MCSCPELNVESRLTIATEFEQFELLTHVKIAIKLSVYLIDHSSAY
jgi:hypothetical protein